MTVDTPFQIESRQELYLWLEATLPGYGFQRTLGRLVIRKTKLVGRVISVVGPRRLKIAHIFPHPMIRFLILLCCIPGVLPGVLLSLLLLLMTRRSGRELEEHLLEHLRTGGPRSREQAASLVVGSSESPLTAYQWVPVTPTPQDTNSVR